MAVKKEMIYDFLNQFIDSKLMPSNCIVYDAFTKDKTIEIGGSDFTFNCWQETTDDGELVCVELSRKVMIFLSESYSLGVLVSRGNKTKVSQRELWNMGF